MLTGIAIHQITVLNKRQADFPRFGRGIYNGIFFTYSIFTMPYL